MGWPILEGMSAGSVSPALVGRGDELATLDDAFSGTPSTVLIGGEAGIGKSRLVQEFATRVGERARVLTGGCVELGGVPYGPFTAALRQLVHDMGADRVAALLPMGGPGQLARLLPALGRPEVDADPGMAHTRLFEEMLTLLDRLTETEDRRLVLVIEDAHWADASSRELLSFLVRNQQSAPASLVAVTYRSDELHHAHPVRPLLAELDRLTWVERLELSRLRKREVTTQARAILGREPKAELIEQIYQRSEGNPLFVEALLATGAHDLPESLSDLLLTRIRQLPEQTQHVLRMAAVAGGRVAHGLLTAVTGVDDAALAQALRPAGAANLLVADADAYTFRHALTGEAVYRDLLPGERIAWHTRYAEVLDGDPGARQELAYHWFAAHNVPRALSAAWHAAADAERILAYTEQLVMLSRVLDLWDEAPGTVELLGVDQTTVLERAVAAAERAGEYQRGDALVTQALRAIDPDHDPGRAAHLLQRRSVMRWHLGREDDLADLREAVRIAPAGDQVRAPVLVALALRLMQIPEHEQARAAAAQALTAARRTGDAQAEAMALISLATLAARQGDIAQVDRLAEARMIAESIGDHATLMLALHWQASVLVAYGQCQRAAETARHGIAVATRIGLARTSGAVHAANLVDALIGLGRWDEALEVADHTLDLAPIPDLRAHLLRVRGEIALARGDIELPETAVKETRDVVVVRDTQDASETLPLAGLEIELSLAQDRAAEAITIAEQALAGPDLQRSARFAWPLLVTGARATRQAAANTERAAALLAGLRSHAEKLPIVTPVQRAHSLTFAAESARALGAPSSSAWDAAAACWHDLAQPYPEARALLDAAEAAAAAGDRAGSAVRLRRAAELANRLEACRLRDQIDDLARRARIVLWPNDALPTDDPLEQARRRTGLTPREFEVLRLVADGKANREIAAELFISAKTASVHVSNILTKLGLATRVQAAAAAHRLHLIDDQGQDPA